MRTKQMIKALQVFWGLGVAAWNAYGMIQIQNSAAPPGPTSSWLVAGLGLVIAIVFGFDLLKGKKWLYLLLCLLCVAMGSAIVYGAFTQDPSLWPSETWRWGGIVLNGIGVLACFFGMIKYRRQELLDLV